MELKPPANADELRRFVTDTLKVNIPGRKLCRNHDAPWDYIRDCFFDRSDRVVWANRGGGKTMAAAVATVLDAVFHSETEIIIIGGSQDQSDRVAEYVRRLLVDLPHLIHKSTTRRKIRLTNGSSVLMLAQSEKAVRGTHVQRIRCDELELFDEDVWRAIQFCTISRRGSKGTLEVLSTAHKAGGRMAKLVTEARGGTYPGRLYSWCLWEVIQRCDATERTCGECLLQDDCGGAARKADGYFGIDDAIAIKARSSRSAWESEMLCLGAQREYLVFPEFHLSRHVEKVPYCPDWPLYRAIDFGYRSPLVCLWIQLTPSGRAHVIQEYVRSRLPLNRHAQEILKRDPAPAAVTYVDPAGRQKESTSGAACTEMLAAAGINCTCRASTISEGLELVRAALQPAAGEASLAIDPSCQHLIEAFNSYHYPPPESARDSDKPVKDGPDHAIDALRYFFVNRMRPKIAIRRGSY